MSRKILADSILGQARGHWKALGDVARATDAATSDHLMDSAGPSLAPTEHLLTLAAEVLRLQTGPSSALRTDLGFLLDQSRDMCSLSWHFTDDAEVMSLLELDEAFWMHWHPNNPQSGSDGWQILARQVRFAGRDMFPAAVDTISGAIEQIVDYWLLRERGDALVAHTQNAYLAFTAERRQVDGILMHPVQRIDYFALANQQERARAAGDAWRKSWQVWRDSKALMVVE